jgi:3-polyprenyl-4-hydroxybenzoate decarboxylase
VTAPRRPWLVGVTGASGIPYAAAILRGLLDAGEDVDVMVSQAARLMLLDETGHSGARQALGGRPVVLARPGRVRRPVLAGR